MLTGIKLRATPTKHQRLILSQWMGCARSIWNAKVAEEKYYRTYARKYCVIGTYAPIDQKYSQFKDKELTPYLSQCPSQILRNSAVNWYQTYQKFMSRQCGRPRHKPKTDKGSIHITSELFRFERCKDGNIRLFVGSKTNNIGYLSFKSHGKFNTPNSIYIRKECGIYTVSFCYDNGKQEESTNAQHLEYLKGATQEYLDQYTVGIDRGVKVPVQVGDSSFDHSDIHKHRLAKKEKYIKRLQRKLARQQKTSNRRKRTKQRISKHFAKQGNIRNEFAHQTSRALVNSQAKIFIFENLKTRNMTKKAKPVQDENGKFIKNGAAQKSGLNKSILSVGWYKIESYTKYKAYQAGKAFFKISPSYTSQECALCGSIHSSNRKTQEKFKCIACNHVDHADRNASLIIKKRAIKFILNTGTVLSDDNVLSDSARGGQRKSRKAKSSSRSDQRNAKKDGGVLPLEAMSL